MTTVRNAERARLIRQSRRRLRLGEPFPVCATCGCDKVETLTGVSWSELPTWVQRKIIQRHHPAGRAAEPGWTVPLCLTCHALASERQRDLPLEVRRPRTKRDRQRALLHGVIDVLRIFEEGARSARAVVERVIS